MSQPWMAAPNLPGIGGTSTSRYVALVAVLTALFTAYGYLSSIELRTVTRSLDLFFLLPAFFAILVSLTGKKWAGTILGTVIGLIFLGTRRLAPDPRNTLAYVSYQVEGTLGN